MFPVEIITPEEVIYKGEADSLTLPTGDGEITVLTGHIPLITTLVPGTIFLKTGKEETVFAVSRGVVEITREDTRILAQTADRADTLEEAAIEKAKEKAEKLMSEKRQDAEAFAEASAVLERELARLKTVRRHRSRSRGPTLPS